jgi:serine/threonine protein kinase
MSVGEKSTTTVKEKNFVVRRIGCHHDLRPANILLLDGRFVITDFGLSRLKPSSGTSKDPLGGGVDEYLETEMTEMQRWMNCQKFANAPVGL